MGHETAELLGIARPQEEVLVVGLEGEEADLDAGEALSAGQDDDKERVELG